MELINSLDENCVLVRLGKKKNQTNKQAPKQTTTYKASLGRLLHSYGAGALLLTIRHRKGTPGVQAVAFRAPLCFLGKEEPEDLALELLRLSEIQAGVRMRGGAVF